MKILLDPGHSRNTPGKCSPDGRFREYQYTREIAAAVVARLQALGSDGQWHTATGWSCYTSPGQTAGDRLADCLYRAAEKHLQGHKIRTDYSDGDADKEARFALLTRTRCAAALTENGFQDSKESLAFLESPAGKKAVIGLHVEGIIDFLANILPG